MLNFFVLRLDRLQEESADKWRYFRLEVSIDHFDIKTVSESTFGQLWRFCVEREENSSFSSVNNESE